MEYGPENNIFVLKMMMKSGLEKNILKFHDGLQSCCRLLPSAKKSAQKGLFGLDGQQVCLKFKILTYFLGLGGDSGSLKTGNAGGRLACGIIEPLN